MKYKTVLFFTLIITSASSVFADYIHLKNGTLLQGKVLKVTDSSIEYDPEGSIPFDTINRADVEKIVYDNGKSVIISESASSNTAVPEKAKEASSGTVQRNSTISENTSKDPGFHRHDGFFFRGYYGLGVTNSKVTSAYGDFKFTGIDANFGLQLGYAVVDNVIPFVEYRSIMTTAATTKYGGKTYTSADNDQKVNGGGFAIGLCVYIPNTQLYVSAAMYTHIVIYDGDFINETTDKGKAFGLSIGYELWASDNWGVGLAAFYYYGKSNFSKSSYEDQKSEYYRFDKTTYQSVGIGLSCTYN